MEYKNVYEDFFYSTTAVTLSYRIEDEDGEPVFVGRAVGGTGGTRVNVAQKIRDWLFNDIGDFRDSDGELFSHPDAVHAFSLVDLSDGEVKEQWMVLYGWEGGWDGSQALTTTSINGHASVAQKLFFTNGLPVDGPGGSMDITDGGPGDGPGGSGEGGDDGPVDDYFTVEAIDEGYLYVERGSVQYLMDGGVWTSLAENERLRVPQGSRVKLKGSDLDITFNFESGDSSNVSRRYNVLGNPLSLYWGDDFKGKTTTGDVPVKFPVFVREKVVDASRMYLPLTTVRYIEDDSTGMPVGQYTRMFLNCLELVKAPNIYATTVEAGGCSYMFNGCPLTEAPEIRTTTVGERAFQRLFTYAVFTTPPVLHVQNVAPFCFDEMFYGCTNLTTPPQLPPVDTMALSCYSSMFHGCTSLTKAPELPATQLAVRCYYNMFHGCTSLTKAPVLPATHVMSAPTSTQQYPQGCYESMFESCTSLSEVTVYATTQSGRLSPFLYWLYGVASTGTIYRRSLPTTTGYSGVPSGWTVVQI